MQKKRRVLIFGLFLAIGLEAMAQSFGGGSGTENDPYLIASKRDMVALAVAVNSGNSYSGSFFLLTRDLTDVATTIGNAKENYFGGIFDGGNHIINAGIDVNCSSSSTAAFAGIFGCLSGAIVKNLLVTGNVSASSLTSKTSNTSLAGGICGYAYRSTIINCANTCDVSSQSKYSSSDDVCEGDCAGGICGLAKESTINFCYNTGDIAAFNFTYNSDYSNITPIAGGVCGNMTATTVSFSYNTGRVTAQSTYYNYESSAGGICGYSRGKIVESSLVYSRINYCYNTGSIISELSGALSYSLPVFAGGICGWSLGTTIITGCFAANATITGKMGNEYGGKIGRIRGQGDYSSAVVDMCYAASSMNLNGATITSQSISGAHGRDASMASFQSQVWLEDNLLWDFDDTWYFSSGTGGFPLLKKDQRIEFELMVTELTYGDQTQVGLAATSSNNSEPIVFTSSDNHIAEVTGATLHIKKAGTVVITASQPSLNMYKSATVNRSLTIKPKLLTVRANDLSRVYGDSLPRFTANYDGFVSGESEADLTQLPTFSCSATLTSNVGTYVVTPCAAQSPNYTFTYETGQLTVTKAPLKVYLPDTTFCYGESYPSMMLLQYEGLKNNEQQPALKAGNKIYLNWKAGQKPGTYSSTFAPGEPINYVYLPYEGNTFTITKAPLQVFVSDTFKVYGADPTVFTLTYSGFKYGDTVDSLLGVPTAKTLATATSPVGDYPITMTGGESDCYTFVYQPCTLHVTRADLTVVALDTTKVYGEKNPAFAVSYMGLRNSDTEAVLPNMTVKSTADVQSGVGTYHIVPEGPFETDNYRVFYQQGALSVLPAPLTVQVKDTSRYYGVANPAFEAVYSGFRNGDSIDVLLNRPTFSTMANDTSWVGDSVVTVSGGRADNYHFDTYLPGTLMIKKAPLTFYLEDVEMEYGDKTFSYSTYYDGYCDNKDSLYYFVRRFAIETETDSTSKPGTYPVMFSGPSSSNYDVNYESEDLTIYTRILKVKAGSYTRQYGFPNPEFVLAYEGFVNNDTPDSLEIQPVAVCTATDTSGVGEYSVEIPAVFPTCYRLFRYNGTLTITPLEQSIIWEQALDSLIQGQQVFLSAATTAALPVSFSLEPNNVARLYKANGQTYLDCFGHGQVLLKAFQGGNDNVFSAPNNTKVINVLPLQTAKSYTLTIQSGEGGVTKQAVDSGSQVRIGIEPSLGWVVHTVSFNGVEVTDSLVGSVFITPPMMSDGLLSITFELINQAVEMVVSPVKVYTRPSEIVVYGLTPGETVELYGINGTVERKVLAERNEQSFSVRPGAAYLVRAGGKTVKVVL